MAKTAIGKDEVAVIGGRAKSIGTASWRSQYRDLKEAKALLDELAS